ncbi:MAG TPA: hypothetical protein VMV69_18070 [Pirellulales bacterium]|nr:hypothetical protein [Pirellulales bacterium]
MNVFRLLALSLIVAVGVGCGNDPAPPAAAPPKFEPASDLLTAKEAAGKPSAVAPTGGAENALDADESPAETAANEDMADEIGSASTPDAPAGIVDSDDTVGVGSVASDEDPPAATSENGSPDPLPESTADTPAEEKPGETKPVGAKSGKTKSGRWMRGLTGALNRAFAKSLDKAAQGAGAAAKQPAPEDDPFPKGEPEEDQPKD